MKKTLFIASLGLITTLGYSQSTPTNNAAPNQKENVLKPATEKETEVASPSDFTTTHLIEIPTANAEQDKLQREQLKKSKAISMQLMQSLSKSNSTIISKDLLNEAIKMINEGSDIEALFTVFRTMMKATPDQAYKSNNAEAGHIMTGAFTQDVDYPALNSLIMKWEMLLKPECFDAAWKTNEANWKKDIKAASK